MMGSGAGPFAVVDAGKGATNDTRSSLVQGARFPAFYTDFAPLGLGERQFSVAVPGFTPRAL